MISLVIVVSMSTFQTTLDLEEIDVPHNFFISNLIKSIMAYLVINVSNDGPVIVKREAVFRFLNVINIKDKILL